MNILYKRAIDKKTTKSVENNERSNKKKKKITEKNQNFTRMAIPWPPSNDIPKILVLFCLAENFRANYSYSL